MQHHYLLPKIIEYTRHKGLFTVNEVAEYLGTYPERISYILHKEQIWNEWGKNGAPFVKIDRQTWKYKGC